MEYKKKFFEEDGVKKIKITAPEIAPAEIKELRDLKKMPFLGTKTFEVVEKEKIYEWIKKGQSIELKDKYVKGFSLKEYRKNNEMGDSEVVVLKNFNAKEAFFDEDVDFSHAVFDGNVYFVGSFFEKGVYFCSVNFGDGNANFGRTIFGEGCVNFMLSTFGKGNVNFRQADFGEGLVDFRMATFGGGNIDFSQATFGGGNVFFERANFGGGNVDFSQTSFEKREVSFFDANFERGDVSFKNATFGDGYILFPSLKVQGDWNMGLVRANIIDFSNSLIHGTINFTGAKIKQLRLINTQLTGKIFISSEELRLGRRLKRQKDAINVQEDTSHREKRDQFRLLKENFRNLGQYDDEDRAYVQFMEHKIISEKEFKEGDSRWDTLKKIIIYGYKRLVFASMGKYGTSPRNVVVSMAVVVTSFSILYLPFASLDNISLSNNLHPWGIRVNNSIYHSIITFFTIGYGDKYVYPGLWARVFSGIEGFAGIFLISYFTFTFVRKVFR